MDPHPSISPVQLSGGSFNNEWMDSFGHVVCYESEFDKGIGDVQAKYEDINKNSYCFPSKQEVLKSGIRQENRNELFKSPSKAFKAFTETVEALALQQSVIGGMNVKPLMSDEVARVVAETKRKLGRGVESTDGLNYSDGQSVDTSVLEMRQETAAVTEVELSGEVKVITDGDQTQRLIRIPSETLKTERQSFSKLTWSVSPKGSLLPRSSAGCARDSEARRNILLTTFASPECQQSQAVEFADRNGELWSAIEPEEGSSDAVERARLQGRLDVLQAENRELLEARSNLERRVADLSARVRAAEESVGRPRQEDEQALRNLQSHRVRLEAVVLDAHRLLSEKDGEITSLGEELEGSRRLAERLEEQVLQGRSEVQSLGTTIKDLKSKITEMYVDLQTTEQNRILSVNEVQSLQGELRAALAAKEWYKEQLTLCQKDKSELQAEVTSTKGEMIRQATTVEKLKAENTRTKVYLNEVEQRLLSEKLALVRHLETIEAEMLEREVLLMQSNKEYMTLRIVDGQGSDRGPDGGDTAGPSMRTNHTGDSTEAELVRCRAELEKVKALHEEAAANLAECQRTCSSLRDSSQEREQSLVSLEGERSQLIEQLGQLRLKLSERDDRIHAAEQEKAVLQMDLASTKEEKKVIDESLTSLRQNLKVVEQNFNLMKVELVGKSEELDQARRLLEGRFNSVSLREIADDGLGFLSPAFPPLARTSGTDVSVQTSVPVPSGPEESLDRVRREKEDTEIKLLVILNQLKASQERQECQSEALRSLEQELKRTKMDAACAREELRSSSTSPASSEKDLSTSRSSSMKDALTDQDSSEKAASTDLDLSKKSASTNADAGLKRVHVVRCEAQGNCTPTMKARPTHLGGLDSREVKQVFEESLDEIDGLSTVDEVDLIRSTIKPDMTYVQGSKDHINNISGSKFGSEAIPERCSNCPKCPELERRSDDLRQRLTEAERKAMAAEEQRNKVIFLEDQLDQANQSKEVEEIRHQGEVERLTGELASLEGEVQRLQEEVLLLRFNSQNTAYRDASESFKNALFESSRKKFYGARMFEMEELDVTSLPSEVHRESGLVAEPPPVYDQSSRTNQTTDANHLSPDHEIEVTLGHDLQSSEREQLEQRLQLALQEKDSLSGRIEEIGSAVNRLSEENASLRESLATVRSASSEEVEAHKMAKAGLELRLYELSISVQNERNILIHNFSLELERERGKFMELSNSHQLLKEHASRLEKCLALRESSSIQAGSAPSSSSELESEIEELRKRIGQLEKDVLDEQSQHKDTKKAMLIERGNNVRLRLDSEELTMQNKHLSQEAASLREQVASLTGKMESMEQDISRMTLEIERLTSEVRIRVAEEEKLKRESGDLVVRDATLKDQIRTLEWKLSQRGSELAASEERIELMSERQMCEVKSLTESLQTKTTELQTLQAEMVALTRERSELRARIVQFKRAITDILKQHSHASEKGRMSVNELILNKEEMEKLLVDALPQSADNKPLSFLQVTLSSLRGEIDSLQMQVNEHTTAVQSSSMAWRELEAQVQDLRRLCRSSAASRAQSDQLSQDTDQLIAHLPEVPPSVHAAVVSSVARTTVASVVTKTTRTMIEK